MTRYLFSPSNFVVEPMTAQQLHRLSKEKIKLRNRFITGILLILMIVGMGGMV